MGKHNFRKLEIWKIAMSLVTEVYKVIEHFPSEERYGLRSQITRCAVSIPSNIAEGSSRSSIKEFSHFLDIANGSCFELETQLILASNLFNIENDELIERCQQLQRMIIGFKDHLK
jgi:four helix bundle protein